MNKTPEFTEQDILHAIHLLKASGFGTLLVDVQQRRVKSCAVTYTVHAPLELHRLAVQRHSSDPHPLKGTA